MQGCDFSGFPDFLSWLRIFVVTASGRFVLDFLKPKKIPSGKKKTWGNLIIISSSREEETNNNIERSWNFRPDLISVCEVHIPDWLIDSVVLKSGIANTAIFVFDNFI